MAPQISILDWLIMIFLFVTGGFFLYVYTRISSKPDMHYLFRGYLIKLAGGVFFAYIYLYVYTFGDTFRYYIEIVKLNRVAMNDVGVYTQLMTTSSLDAASPSLVQHMQEFGFSRETEGWFFVRINSLFAFLSGNSYLGLVFWMALVSLFGSWQFFRLSNYLLDNNRRWSFIVAFLVPSVVFWGSGLLKDTYTMAAVSVWCLAFYQLLNRKGFWLRQVVFLLVASYVLYILKAYILLSLLPWLFISSYLAFTRRIQAKVLLYASIPLLITLVTALIFYVSTSLADSTTKYSTEVLDSRAEGFHSWHKTLGGSYYDIGEVEYSPTGILRVAPKALSFTLFRPFFWESNNALMLLTSFEGAIFLVLILYLFVKMRFRMFTVLYRSSFLFGGFIYCVLFGVAVGMNSYNYGALARYKIPMLSIFLLIIVFLIHTIKKEETTVEVKTQEALS